MCFNLTRFPYDYLQNVPLSAQNQKIAILPVHQPAVNETQLKRMTKKSRWHETGYSFLFETVKLPAFPLISCKEGKNYTAQTK